MISSAPWQPSTFRRWECSYDTSVGTARIITDAGPAYIKPLGNAEGPHVLACEWVGTHLARWFGLPTLDFALMNVNSDADEIPLGRDGRKATSGPAFVTRAVEGQPWGGSAEELDTLENPEAITKLVVFDTWTLNCDRFGPEVARPRVNRDNVFLCRDGMEDGRFRLIAIDHTHCFTCGRQLTPRIASIERVQCEKVFGLFPEFEPWITKDVVESATARLRQLNAQTVNDAVDGIPAEWDVSAGARAALRELICQRAAFVASYIPKYLARYGPARQTTIPWPEEDGG